MEQVREHGGLASNSYVLTNLSTGKSLTRIEGLIRKLGGMTVNNIPVRKDLVLPMDKVRNSEDADIHQEERTHKEQAMTVQVKHVMVGPLSLGKGILRCQQRETVPEEREEPAHPGNSVSWSRILKVITHGDQSFTRLVDHNDIHDEPLWHD